MKKHLFITLILGLLSTLLVACGGGSSSTGEAITVDTIINAFQDAGLEAENPTDLENKEFGNTRKEGKRIFVPALGEDAGGRLFEFENTSDLEDAKSYYDELSKGGPLFFSHTYAKGNFLLQMNGEMEDAEFEKYKAVMEAIIDGKKVSIETSDPEDSNQVDNLKDAKEGEIFVEDMMGTYEITKVIVPENNQYSSASVNFTFEELKFAKFTPEDPGMFEGQEELSLAVMFLTSENTSDETVSFHPFSTILTTDTKQQIDAQMWLNDSESEFIGNVIHEQRVAFNLGEETHEDISKITFTIDGTAKDAMTVGEDVTIVVPIN